MPRDITIDDDVWAHMKMHAQPLEDTPNSVLRRLFDLEPNNREELPMQTFGAPYIRSPRTDSGKRLNALWNVGARHALYHKDGCYFNRLVRFPGALFDPNGYVMFETEDEYLHSPYLQIGQQLNIPTGISRLPGYKRAPEPGTGRA